jgi:hypothetical protein
MILRKVIVNAEIMKARIISNTLAFRITPMAIVPIRGPIKLMVLTCKSFIVNTD